MEEHYKIQMTKLKRFHDLFGKMYMYKCEHENKYVFFNVEFDMQFIYFIFDADLMTINNVPDCPTRAPMAMLLIDHVGLIKDKDTLNNKVLAIKCHDKFDNEDDTYDFHAYIFIEDQEVKSNIDLNDNDLMASIKFRKKKYTGEYEI